MTESEARTAGWFRFAQVKQFVPDGQSLYRSSAPNYEKLPSGDHDASQNLTQKAVDFLVKIGIDSIISLNRYRYKPDQLAKLENANPQIAYLHLPVYDGYAPTLEELRKASNFFLGKKSTLVHAGFGVGRTATGITALQISTVFGQALEPFASTWSGSEGNQVETRRQMSALAELRNVLLQSKIKDITNIEHMKTYAIINAATGYYLSVSEDNKTIVALSPETVERGPRTRSQYLWTIQKNESTNEYALSNRVTFESFVITKANGVAAGDPVENGPTEGANNLFTIAEVQPDPKARTHINRGHYIISPVGSDLAVSIHQPDGHLKRLYYTKQTSALLSEKDKAVRYGQWILLRIFNAPGTGS